MAMSAPSSVGLLGGTGPAGRAFATRLASSGFEVRIGSRSADRAESASQKILSRWADARLDLSGGDNDFAADADLVVVATPWDVAASTTADLRAELDGKIVLSMANAIAMVEGELQPILPARGSVAAGVQAVLPNSMVVAAMHHVPARELGDLSGDLDCDVLVCSDHDDARRVVLELVDRLDGLRGVDAGTLANAGAIESFTAVILGINRRYGSRSTIRLSGLPETADQDLL